MNILNRSVQYFESCLPTVVVGLFVGGGLLFQTGCSPQAAANAGMGAPRLPSVTVAPVESREVVEYQEFTGRVDAIESVEVRARVSGHLQEVRFQAGQRVEKGDVLFVIDPRWHQAAFAAAEAESKRAHSKLENAKREAARAEQLLLEKAISTEETEGRRSKLSEATAASAVADATLNSARLDLEFTEVRAPISGKISRALVTVGNYVSGVAGANTVLTTIVSTDPVYVYADVDEAALLKLNRLQKEGQLPLADGKVPVRVGLSDEVGFPTGGVIESLDNRLDPNTGSILLRAVVPNPEGRFVPGLFARLQVPASPRRPVALIQESAIGTDQSQKFVLTLSSSNTVDYRPIQIGPVLDGKRIVRNGLAPGEKVVVNGLMRVRPGMPVEAQLAQ